MTQCQWFILACADDILLLLHLQYLKHVLQVLGAQESRVLSPTGTVEAIAGQNKHFGAEPMAVEQVADLTLSRPGGLL